jgi:hypothetical protein
MPSLAEFALRVLWSLDTIRSVSAALAKVGMKVFNSPHSPIHYVAQYVDRRWHIAFRLVRHTRFPPDPKLQHSLWADYLISEVITFSRTSLR